MLTRKLSVLASISALALITACSSTSLRNDTVYNPPAAARQGATFGNVSSIEIVSTATPASGGGALLGAVIGGVLGNQVGGGSGRTAATAVGIVGGAVIGNQVEQRNKGDGELYRISVRLDNGSIAQFDYQRIGDLRVGDRVRVQDGQLNRI
jgi:outer membrane lipoprotein SlyB